MDIPWKRAIVIGASSGIGEQIARKLAAQGCTVAIVSRREDRLAQIAAELNGASLDAARVFPYDVTEAEKTAERFHEMVDNLGGLDLFVYAAGVMPKIDPAEYSSEKDLPILETNLTSAIAWINQAAKRFERMKGGTIVGIGSVSGDRGRRGNPAYGASKAGLACYLESLRNRLSARGVSVVTAKPGPVATEMTAELGRLPGMITADRAAELILKGARRFSKTIYVPWKWGLVSLIIRMIPSPIFRRMKI